MILYLDSENKIRAVNSSTDETLTPVYVDENVEMFPFKGWSTAKICCYMVTVEDGIITMYTPYVDSRVLEFVDMMGHQIDDITPHKETKTAYIDDTEITFTDIPEGDMTVFVSNPAIEYSVTRENSYVTVVFAAPLEEVIKVTISVQ